MTKEKEQKLNLETFIKKAVDKHQNRELVFEIYVEGHGLMDFNRPSNKDLLNYIDKVSNALETDENDKVINQNLFEMVDASKELVYKCCPFLQSNELREQLDIKDPLETPVVVFGFKETNAVASKIAKKANGEKIAVEVADEVKN